MKKFFARSRHSHLILFLFLVFFGPTVLSWFLTRFESKGAHGCGEQWNARDMSVYIDSGLREDKNPTSCVHRLHYDLLG
jgi:hypothetical protein